MVGKSPPCTDVKVGPSQLLQEMEGIVSQSRRVFVLAATNFPESIDSAILSRFTERIVSAARSDGPHQVPQADAGQSKDEEDCFRG